MGNPDEPAAEFLLLIIGADGRHGLQKRLLKDLSSLLPVAKHMKRQAQDITIVTVYQLLESLTIATLSLLDEESIFLVGSRSF